MSEYRLVSEPDADLDVEAAFDWYENESRDLGLEFLQELLAAYLRIAERPLAYPTLHSDIRRALLRRFPYAVYFAVEDSTVIVLAVLHARRDPASWQQRKPTV